MTEHEPIACLIDGKLMAYGNQPLPQEGLLALLPTMVEREELQKNGEHPAPCARFCEATAFRIAERQYQKRIERLQNENTQLHGFNNELAQMITSPTRAWVDLTEQELVDLRERVQQYTPMDSIKYGEAIQRATAQALKEKNHD